LAEIVLATDASPSVKKAANELQKHLEAMSGARLPIVAGKNHVILAGRQIYHFSKSFAKFNEIARNQRQQYWEKLIGHKWRFPPIIDYRDYSKEFGFFAKDGTGPFMPFTIFWSS